MSRTPPTYNVHEKVWSGPAFDQRKFDVPFGEMLLNELARHGDKVVQINHDTNETMTCTEMRLRSLKAAEYLKKIGIQIGDNVAIVAHHTGDVVPFLVGAIAYGAVVSVLYAVSTASELCDTFKIAPPKLIVCDGEEIDKVKISLQNAEIDAMIYAFSNHNEHVRSTDEFYRGFDTEHSTFQLPNIVDLEKTITLIVCSSGSTGLPKCIHISHAMILSWIHSSSLTVGDGIIRYYATTPMGLITVGDIAASICFRSPRIITDQKVTTDLILEILQKHNVNVLYLLPYKLTLTVNEMQNASFNLSKLTTILCCGSLSKSTLTYISKMLPNVEISNQYGMSEVGLICCSNANSKQGSVGYLVSGMTAKIIDESGNGLGPGEFGEIYVRGSCPYLGYLNNEEATKSTIDADGWLLTGDNGYFNTNGELFVVDRKKNMIRYKATEVSPTQLEEFVRQHFDVQDIVVVGIPGEDDVGHLPTAIVVLPQNSTVSAADISKAIEDNFSYHNHMHGGVYFVKSIPRAGLEKVQRKQVEQIAIALYAAKMSSL